MVGLLTVGHLVEMLIGLCVIVNSYSYMIYSYDTVAWELYVRGQKTRFCTVGAFVTVGEHSAPLLRLFSRQISKFSCTRPSFLRNIVSISTRLKKLRRSGVERLVPLGIMEPPIEGPLWCLRWNWNFLWMRCIILLLWSSARSYGTIFFCKMLTFF